MKGKWRAEICEWRIQEIWKWNHMDLSTPKKLGAYFGLQKVMESKVFNVRFERNIKSQHR